MSEAVRARVGDHVFRPVQLPDLAEKRRPVDPELARRHPAIDVAMVAAGDPHHAPGGLGRYVEVGHHPIGHGPGPIGGVELETVGPAETLDLTGPDLRYLGLIRQQSGA